MLTLKHAAATVAVALMMSQPAPGQAQQQPAPGQAQQLPAPGQAQQLLETLHTLLEQVAEGLREEEQAELLEVAEALLRQDQVDLQELAAALQQVEEEQQEPEVERPQIVTSGNSVPIRISPPTPLLLGFPGWEVSQTAESERYVVVSAIKINALSSTSTWAQVELVATNGEAKSGWVDLNEWLLEPGAPVEVEEGR
ncbi:MAG: hypothetical protein OXF79_16320 [Chloroflexi bacterium]|nr:hypothetical protein [Chloroflexota bacterium]